VRRHRGAVPNDVVDNSGFPIRMNEWHFRSGRRARQQRHGI
jgi:hypothetical protein